MFVIFTSDLKFETEHVKPEAWGKEWLERIQKRKSSFSSDIINWLPWD